MVEKKQTPPKEKTDYVDLFEILSKNNAERFVYERKRAKFSLAEMQEFALQAFTDKLFILKNVTKNILYEELSQDLHLSENDEIVLIRLKYIRGAI